TGIDITHHAFRKADADGTTRILKIWDQTLDAEGSETVPGQISHPTISPTPTPLGYGVEYSRPQINATLTSSSPAVPVRHVDQDGHGTNVAGIAAGDGSEGGNCHGSYHYIGVATDADILIVRLWGLTEGDSNTLPSSSNAMIDAIRWILNEANNASQPVAINCSFGVFNELKDGTSPDCVAIDQLLTSNSTGRAIVFAAGNDGDSRFHAQATLPVGPTDTLTLEFRIFPDDTESRDLVIVYSGSNIELKLQSPVGGANGLINFVTFGNSGNSTTANGSGTGSSVDISNTQADRISITITPPTGGNNMAGVWTLELRDSSSGPLVTTFDAYCLFGSSHDRKSPHFENHDITRTTMLEEASGKESIAVGAYKVGGRLAVFSARGPTIDLRVKP
ncbi:MAG TPA: S8 family serine peptidase, partial [Pyrinomonadaceae bacterium]|nr:S8 family serine peptidase [Pyrinomonadaceae bacterium]